MSDLASLVLGIPSYVEGFVKVGRAVIKYKSLERDHIETVEDAIFCAGTLKYYAGFVNAKDPGTLNHPSRPLLEEALGHAYDALYTAEGILQSWTLRLSLKPKAHGRMVLAKLANSVAERIIRSKTSGLEDIPSRSRMGHLKMVSEASYLAFGCVEIKEAMTRLNKWTTRLGQLLLTSPNLQLRRDISGTDNMHDDMSDDVAFVACARERATSKRDVLIVDISQLDPKFDIDPDHKSGMYRLSGGDYAGYIVDVRDLALRRGASLEAEARDSEYICRLFAETPSDSEHGARASVGILPCIGYAIGDEGKKHFLLFRLPTGTGTPRTLRSLLLTGPAQHPLNSRLEFCVKLATSVLIVQSLGLVHKNIRPESILVTELLRSDSASATLGTPYLVSFGQARISAGPSDLTSYLGAALARTLYVHPRHLSSRKRRKFQMRDDVYSLGICFLEIAIWKSLFKWDAEKGGFVCDFDLLQISDDHYDEVLQMRGRSVQQDKSWLRRYDIVEFAKKHVPAAMGNTFKDIVVDCLLFGEVDTLSYDATMEKTHEVDTHDDKADLQSVMFVQNILTKLRSLVFTL